MSKDCSAHISLIKSSTSHNLMFASGDNLTISDYHLTTSGCLIIPNSASQLDTFLFTQKYADNRLTRECTLIDFDFSGQTKISNKSFRRDFDHAIWEVLTFSAEGYEDIGRLLRQGDVMRFGDCCMILRLFCPGTEIDFTRTTNYTKFDSVGKPSDEGKNSFVARTDVQCRVCLEDEVQTNPFVNVCACFNSMPVHFNCMRDWFRKTAKPRAENGLTIYDFSELACEVCQQKLPSTAKISSGDELPLVEPQLPHRPFVLLELLSPDQPETLQKVIIMDMGEQSVISIGSHSSNNLPINSRNVSNFHASLEIKNNQIRLYDKKSKFGTFLLLRGEISLKPLQFRLFRVNDYLLEIHPIKTKLCDCFKNGNEFITDPYSLIDELATEDQIPQVQEEVARRSILGNVENKNFAKFSNIKEVARSKLSVFSENVHKKDKVVNPDRQSVRIKGIKDRKILRNSVENEWSMQVSFRGVIIGDAHIGSSILSQIIDDPTSETHS